MEVRVLGFRRDMRPDGRHVDLVQVTNRAAYGDSGQLTHATWHRVAKLIPPDGGDNEGKVLHMRLMWNIIGPAYEAWLKNEEIPQDGTPLAAWAGVSAEKAEVLKGFGVRTVEEVASLPEALVGSIPLPSVRELKRQAALFLDGRDKDELTRRIAALEAERDAAVELLAERDDEPAQEKRGPGRPRKEAA